eukprot:3433843-Alexandrium_andersonii.AAC.1
MATATDRKVLPGKGVDSQAHEAFDKPFECTNLDLSNALTGSVAMCLRVLGDSIILTLVVSACITRPEVQ